MFTNKMTKCMQQISKNCIIARTFITAVPLANQSKVTTKFVDKLKNIVGNPNVSTAEAVREQHGHDASHHDVHMPDVVVFAESVEHVSKVLKLCNDNKVPVVPFGSATGLEGGVNALQGGVSLDLMKMNQIVSVHAQDFDCSVRPGVMRVALNAYLMDLGLWFPLDPAIDTSVCGMCATSASGSNAIRYGTMRENVLNLEVVLPDGRVIDTAGKGRRSKKTSAGYNLTNLFVGSEGTLGVITKATVKLHGIPEKIIAAVCHFKTIQSAIDTVVQILQSGIPMAKLEFLDDKAVDVFNKHGKFKMPVAQTLFFEFSGPALGLEEQFNTTKEIIQANEGSGLQIATDKEERKRLWKARHEMLYFSTALVPGSKAYSTDVCVPVSHLPEVLVKTRQWIDEAKVIGPIVGHVGDGNFHVLFPVNHADKETFLKVQDLHFKMAYLAMEKDGTCTGEHGIGMGKRKLLTKEFGETGIQVLKEVKKCFDPNGIMNPGKMFF